MDVAKALEIVRHKLPKKRFEHSVRVAETAVDMAELFNGDKYICEMAGILHDYCKYDELSEMYQFVIKEKLDPALLGFNNELLHGPVAAIKMRDDYGIKNEEILLAIANHTSGRDHMSLNEKIIYVADYIEPERNQENVEKIRDLVYKENHLDLAVYEITKATIKYLLENDKTIYPRTIDCLNYYNMVKE